MTKRPAQIFTGLMLGALLLTSCTADVDAEETASSSEIVEETTDSDAGAVTEASSDVDEVVDLATLTEATYADLDVEEMDLAISTATAVEIALAEGASSGGAGVSVDGDVVTITEAGVYTLSGTLTDGKIVVDADGEDVHLILDGVDITSSESGAIEVVDADQVALHLASGSTNTVAEASGAADSADGANAAIYATSDLYVTGDGSLEVEATNADGITSKDSLVIDSGSIAVTAADDGLRGKDHLVIRDGDITIDAGGDGLRSDNVSDSDEPDKAVGVVWIEGGTIDITAASDAIDAAVQVTITDGDLTIAAEDDAVHADGILRIDGGTIDVTASYEGLEAGVILLSGGDATIVSSDDAFNATDGSGSSMEMGGMGGGMPGGDGTRPERRSGGPGSSSDSASSATDASSADSTTASADATTASAVTAAYATDATAAVAVSTADIGGESGADGVRLEISGGTWVLDAEGDGVDSNGNVEMTGGTVVVAGPTQSMNGALDYNGSFVLDGGVLIATGSAGMAQAPSGGDQAVIGVSFGQTVSAGETVTVLDSNGDLVASYTSTKDSQTLVLSTPDLVSGDSYEVVFGGTVSGTDVGGLVTDGTLSGGETAGTVSAS
ncbi:carbohydrate-binding domain-containing protein [uncultured Demequina sp.]|uniref:carbohydrate-binding domain-containing protein n=1 Tax=uncultured Demequina sp. TaxID=693499 RepID=UPI0025FE8411|nr:carbohydrate-binding domain-containing protein [uncultured Demequina sp.]